MYKLLIAEDESEMRMLLTKYIKRTQTDIEVVGSATNGKEALELTEKFRPDIILTDISMPVMDGLEFLQKAAAQNILSKSVIVSGYDEFSYARKAIALGVSEYLLKPFDPQELSDALSHIKAELDRQRVLLDNMQLLRKQVDFNETKLREQQLRDMITGKQQVSAQTNVLDIAAKFYCTCLLKMPMRFPDNGWNLSKQEHVDELVSLLGAGGIHRDIHVQGLCFEENSAILILSGDAAEKQHFFMMVKNGIQHLQSSMEKHYHVRLICVLGQIYSDWQLLNLSYDETIHVWKGLISTEKQLIVCGEEPRENREDSQTDASKQVQRLKEQILLSVQFGSEAEAMADLEALIQVYASLAPKKTDFVTISAEELVYTLFNELEQKGIQLDRWQSNEEIQNLIKRQLRNASLLEIKELLSEHFRRCHQRFKEERERQQPSMIAEHIKKLVACHLSDECLTLEWLAEQVHFSSTYIRQLFKQETGESVMEYVIRKRMEHASYLLLKTDMKIQDIAASCGYSNQRYFASSFKKYYECTPTDFKLMMSRGD